MEGKENEREGKKIQQTLEKRQETKRNSGTERRIQHIKKIRNAKVRMNLKRKKNSGTLFKSIKVIFPSVYL